MKRWFPLLTFALLVLAFGVGLQRDPTAMPSAMIGQTLPEFSLPNLYDAEVVITKDDIVGEPFLINVFGSWCVACRVEHAYLNTLGQEIRIIGLNWRDDRADALAWLEALGDPYGLVMADTESDLAINLGVTGAPETFLIDRDGMILQKYVGALDAQVWAREFAPILDRLGAQ